MLFTNHIKNHPPRAHPVLTRITNAKTLLKLTECVQNINWDIVYHCTDPDTAYNRLTNELTKAIHNTQPLKPSFNNKSTPKPWLTKGVSNSIKHKNKLYQKYIKKPTTENKSRYTIYRNKLTHLIRKSKQNHYTELINASKGDSKESWKVINNVLNRGHKRTVLPDLANGSIDDLANDLNDYFVSIGENLAQKNYKTTRSLFQPVHEGQLLKILLPEAYRS